VHGEGADSAGRPVDEHCVARLDLRDIPHHFEIRQTFVLISMALVGIPALMIWVSMTTPCLLHDHPVGK